MDCKQISIHGMKFPEIHFQSKLSVVGQTTCQDESFSANFQQTDWYPPFLFDHRSIFNHENWYLFPPIRCRFEEFHAVLLRSKSTGTTQYLRIFVSVCSSGPQQNQTALRKSSYRASQRSHVGATTCSTRSESDRSGQTSECESRTYFFQQVLVVSCSSCLSCCLQRVVRDMSN